MLFASRSAGAATNLEDSPYLAVIPDPGACDVIITPANGATTLALLNDTTKRVFCVRPGDYRGLGEMRITTSGNQQNRRFLRFDSQDGLRNAVQRPERALFESLEILGSWWVIQGLTIQPRNRATGWFVTIHGGDNVILDGNLADGIDHVPQTTDQNAIVMAGLNGNSATFNSVQNNVVRNGNQPRTPGDYSGIMVLWGTTASENNDYNKILDNEVYDWGDGISVAGHTSDCSEPGIQRGTVIDGNDVYITSAKRIDCNTGALDPNGGCSCSENGIDVKLDPGTSAARWTRITNNRLWGFRPTSPTHPCGGSGALGTALTAGNFCSAHVFAAQNVILDSTLGIVPSRNWIVAGNLISDIRISDGHACCSTAILPSTVSPDLVVQFNTIVDVDSAYEDLSANTDTRCNDVINNSGLKPATPPNPTHYTSYNYLYNSSTENFNGSTNQLFATAQQSQNADYCFWRRRWTSPERVCIPFGRTTAASPHVAAVSHCDPSLGASYGIASISYPTTHPCDDGVDNDGDGFIDWPADPGCADAASNREDSRCQNGLDDDGDGQIDFDGGASLNAGIPFALRDVSCPTAPWNQEGTACGLGAELVGVLWVLRRRGP